jgi:hypothetical protein
VRLSLNQTRADSETSSHLVHGVDIGSAIHGGDIVCKLLSISSVPSGHPGETRSVLAVEFERECRYA